MSAFIDAFAQLPARLRAIFDLDAAAMRVAIRKLHRDVEAALDAAVEARVGEPLASAAVDGVAAAPATANPRPLPARYTVAQSIHRGMRMVNPALWREVYSGTTRLDREQFLVAADHVLDLLRPYTADARHPASHDCAPMTEPAPLTPTGELEALKATVELLDARLGSCVRNDDRRISHLDSRFYALHDRLTKLEAVAHAPQPVARADDVAKLTERVAKLESKEECGSGALLELSERVDSLESCVEDVELLWRFVGDFGDRAEKSTVPGLAMAATKALQARAAHKR